MLGEGSRGCNRCLWCVLLVQAGNIAGQHVAASLQRRPYACWGFAMVSMRCEGAGSWRVAVLYDVVWEECAFGADLFGLFGAGSAWYQQGVYLGIRVVLWFLEVLC